MSLCNRCTDPGMCCREIRLSSHVPFGTKIETLAWLASCWPCDGEIGVPFIPQERGRARYREGYAVSPLDEEWTYSCIYLTDEGRCGNYDHRPNLCRIFTAGIDQPCAMHNAMCPEFS